MNARIMIGLLAGLLTVWPAQADPGWTLLAGDPALWPYADGPNVETVVLPHSVYRMAGVVGMYQGQPAIFSVGGRSRTTYHLDLPGSSPTYPDNRQSHFSIYRPDIGWISADGTDDQDNGDGTWTSIGLTGYNNGNGSLSPLVSQGTGYVADQGFFYDNAVYVYGGYPQWGGQMARYDIASNTWSNVALGDDDGLYTNGGGGLIGDQWYKVHREGFLMHYNAATDTFETDISITGLVDPGFGAVTGVIGDEFYILDRDGSLYAVDPSNALQVPKASALTAVREAGTVVYDGKFYVLGGKTDSSNTTAVDRIQVYDPQTNTWAYSSVNLPDARSGFLAEILGDTLYIGNGLNDLPDEQMAVLNDFLSISMEAVSTPAPEPDPCDFDSDGDCDLDDLDALTLVGDLGTGVAVPPADAKYDITGDSTVGQADLGLWLSAAATTNGHASPYRPGDTDLDRDVDISDFNNLATSFDPGGSNVGNKFSIGDGDGDNDVDITDFNVLASGFAPGGYDGATSVVVAEANPGEVDLIVDLATGEIILDGNAAKISGLQVFSAGNSLLTTDAIADVLQFVISTNTSTYAEGAFVNTGVDGPISLGIMYDILVDARDVTFEYTMIGEPTVRGTVVYIPEPTSLVLLALGGVLVCRRRWA